MGWFRATPLTARSGTGGISVSMLKPPSAGVPTMRLRLGRRAMAATGWADGKAVELLFGDEEHAGKVMLRPADGDGGSRLRAPRKRSPSSIDTTFGYLPRDPIPGAAGTEWTLLQAPHPAVEVDWSHAENALVITLPSGWWAVRETAAAPERPTVRTAIFPPAPAPLTLPPKPAPPRPVEDDKIERCVALIGDGLLDGEIIRKVRCSPQFLADCKAERSKRLAAARGAVANGGARP